ncbi:MAG: hypothetical protein ACD_20C00298G0006 [uncultured bacterium]|nr:MAG: hypothetical protein ACD_20C00298G0006 [uncultured bacterium]HBH19340.1 hypothetical protein [Cyanobacteria bacterium UBA9579]
MFFLIVLILGLIAGFLSGLLAVGGGIIVIPVFLYILPLLGYDPLSVNQVTGISSVQVITGSLFAFLAHKKYGLMNKDLLYTVGIASGIGALVGSILSKYVSGNVLLIVYFITLAISLLALLHRENISDENAGRKRPILVTVSSFITGILAGALGVGGAVLFIPILTHFYGMSFRTSISNVTYIVLIAAVMTFIGKIATNQVPFDLVIFVIIGAFFGAKIGTKLSHKLPSSVLRGILVAIILITAVRVLISII